MRSVSPTALFTDFPLFSDSILKCACAFKALTEKKKNTCISYMNKSVNSCLTYVPCLIQSSVQTFLIDEAVVSAAISVLCKTKWLHFCLMIISVCHHKGKLTFPPTLLLST